MSGIEEIMTYERMAEQARMERPWLADNFQRQADILREKMEHEAALWADLQEMSSNKSRSAQLAALLGSQYSEMEQRIGRLAGALWSEKLITQAQFEEVKRRLREPSPTQAKMKRQAELENKQYDEAQAAIFAAVGIENKSEAARIYNTLDGQRDEDKLRRWVSELIRAKLLPGSYSVVIRYSEGVNKMKQLFSNLENK